MKICRVGAELFHEETLKDGWTDMPKFSRFSKLCGRT